MTVEEMKKRKSELGLSYEQIAGLSGVPLGTVQKVFSGITRNPRYATLQALSRAFSSAGTEVRGNVTTYSRMRENGTEKESEARGEKAEFSRARENAAGMLSDAAGEYGGKKFQESCTGMLRETGGSFGRGSYGVSGSSALKPENSSGNDHNNGIDRIKYPRQGEYTLDDYLALPDDQRVEMIDGVFYDMSSPLNTHQIISHLLGHYFESFIDENGGPCQVFEAPTDVQLDMDNKTIVQPDILIVCDPEKVRLERIYGAPDLVIEILSKSTRRKDQTLKMWKYADAGVREYWIVDPKKLTVAVYDFAHGDELTLYTFHDSVPVGIYDGACRIDFEKIWKRIERFYPEDVRQE